MNEIKLEDEFKNSIIMDEIKLEDEFSSAFSEINDVRICENFSVNKSYDTIHEVESPDIVNQFKGNKCKFVRTEPFREENTPNIIKNENEYSKEVIENFAAENGAVWIKDENIKCDTDSINIGEDNCFLENGNMECSFPVINLDNNLETHGHMEEASPHPPRNSNWNENTFISTFSKTNNHLPKGISVIKQEIQEDMIKLKSKTFKCQLCDYGMQEGFKFPREHYDICSSNFCNEKNANWFYNKPLSPSQETSNSLPDLSNPKENQRIMRNTIQIKNEKVTSDNEERVDDYLNDPDYEFPEHEDFHSDKYSTSIEILSSSGNMSSSFDHSQNAEMPKTRTENDSQVERKENFSNSENIESDYVDETKTQKKVFCYFCETLVTNFARHLSRNHSVAAEVQKILALPPLSSRRITLLSNLRKKGKYLMSNTLVKPVRRGAENSKFLPCVDCLGYYSVKNLWRHRKQCILNLNKNLSGKRVQCEAQNFMLRNLKVDSQLKTYVFPRMRADKISLIAKRDQLICELASRYLKSHKKKHSIPVTSRKMRDLGRLLFEIKKLEPSIDCLCTALHPKYYDILVTATKNAAKFDTENQTYMSPTYALQMGTTLKQCCDIAVLHASKKSKILASVQSATSEADLKILIQLITGNWKFDVSSQAASGLKLQKWNKISMIPLAEDLKLLKDHLMEMAKKSLVKLEKDNRDCNAYNTLLETIYCRLLLLNRLRPGELQGLLLQTYKSVSNMQMEQEYEEFSEASSETEKILMKKFKGIVIREKNGKRVPVLISEDVQEHMNVILKTKKNFYTESNIYLFGKPNSTEPIVGYKIMKKYATKCGSKNPDALTCPKLRKHLATLTQLFNMSENEMEQLVSFMGHRLGIHRLSYRLPDDVHQTARISKLLILMEKGEAGQFKGKSLDEIDLNLEQNLMDEQRRRLLVAWTEEQKMVVREYFERNIKDKRPPKKHECNSLKTLHPNLLKNKDWRKIKVFIQNEYKKLLTE